MKWRNIGPYRGGRSLAVAGHPTRTNEYYFGAVGGGIWKSDDGGNTWFAVSDSNITSSSIGTIAIAPSEPETVWAGTGEGEIRGNTANGDGIYRSLNGGKSWKYMGLKETRVIADIDIHPKNASVVFAAALGNPFLRDRHRGVYRTTDGGATWQQVLYLNDSCGAIDMDIDPNNPDIIVVAMWEAWRKPWAMSSGGAVSGLYRSTDGGSTWHELSKKPGMPKGLVGRCGVSFSKAKPNRLWAIVENEKGGLFLSDNGGDTWSRASDEALIRQRPWYFSVIKADPVDPQTIYALNVQFHRTRDGGKSWETINTGHVDYHDLWIDPNDPNRMIIADDGGAEVSVNAGQTWTALDLPTAQFYHVTCDNDFPYNVYGAQQDNTSVGVASRTTGWSIGERDYFVAAGGESGYLAVDPTNSKVIYGGNYGGNLTRLDREREIDREVSVYPENPVGSGAESHKHRFQWTYPILFSPHNPKRLYACGERVFVSETEGQTWTPLSDDLTRNEKDKQKASGGPISKDNTGVETYCTIFSFAESPVKEGLYWAGTDDGLVHVSEDLGKQWKNVTPAAMAAYSLVSTIEPSRYNAGTVYLAATRYKLGDEKPYLYRSQDFGRTWVEINKGIPEGAFTRVIREDPHRQGLLYCGTEKGVYVSFDNGDIWSPLQLNMPITPIHDLFVHAREKDLVAATHGRSFWILDDLTPLHQWTAQAPASPKLLVPRHAYRMRGGSYVSPKMSEGENATNGLVVYYWLPKASKEEVLLQFADSKGDTIITFSSKKDQKGNKAQEAPDFYPNPDDRKPDLVPADSGMNRFVWGMRTPPAREIPGAVLWAASIAGPKVPPGRYEVRLIVGKDTLRQNAEIRKDPRNTSTAEDFAEQFSFAMKVHGGVTKVHSTILNIRDLRLQINGVLDRISGLDTSLTKDVRELSKAIVDTLQTIEQALIQTKAKRGQDLLNYPMALNNKLAALGSTIASAEGRPTKQTYDAFTEISARIEARIAQFAEVAGKGIDRFNEVYRKLALEPVRLKKE